MKKEIKKQILYTQGLHCASCEILVEKKLLELKNVKLVEVSMNEGKTIIKYQGEKPKMEELNKLFRSEKYIFFERPIKKSTFSKKNFWWSFKISLILILIFIGLNRLGLSRFINVTSQSSWPLFFVFGLLAGISGCAALTGGIILSMSKQWNELYAKNDSFWQKIRPHLIFNLGRIISFGFLGAILGIIGKKLNFTPKVGAILVLLVSIMMIALALQMLGLRALRKFQIIMPKFIIKFASSESNFKGKYMPFLMGVFTFFLPCGFTMTAEGLALASGSVTTGSLIMLAFVVGTTPVLLFIGLSSVKFFEKAHFSDRFLKIAGFLVIFFSLYNINFQLNILNLPNLSDIRVDSTLQAASTVKNKNINFNEKPLILGKQVLKMEASSSGYSPNYFKVKVGVPVRWEITDAGTSGCTSAVIAQNLFEGEISLVHGQVSVKEFTPSKTGKYKFSCWMGMVSGVIEVVN